MFFTLHCFYFIGSCCLIIEFGYMLCIYTSVNCRRDQSLLLTDDMMLLAHSEAAFHTIVIMICLPLSSLEQHVTCLQYGKLQFLKYYYYYYATLYYFCCMNE